MAPRQNELLLQLVKGQAELTTKVDTMNTRLFGGPGQEGVLKYFHAKNEEQDKEIQVAKDHIRDTIDKLKTTELKEVQLEVTDLKTKSTITLWKTGSLSGFLGSGVGIGLTLIAKKIFHF